MNFAAFSAVGAGGAHFVTTGGQLPVTKLQQNVTNNGMSQVIGMVGGVNMGEGVQYVRTLDGGAALQATPQIISVPITLPGTKPGDPQPTVQIQVLNPNLMQQQQPKYQMQIPIQGFQQGGAVLTLAYSPEANESGGIQLIGNTLPESLVLAALPQEMQLMQQHQPQDSKEQIQQNIQHQVFITPNNEIVINGPNTKALNNNNSANNNNNDISRIIIKEECVDSIDDESSQGTESGDNVQWQLGNNSEDLVKYLNTLPPQQAQQLPASLQQFLRLNKTDIKKQNVEEMEISTAEDTKKDVITEAVLDGDGTIRIQNKKKKKYKKKPPKTPSRPKPGQVIIATAADGTPIFCCPECTMAYPDKSQLEMHLSVHKIERRFICGLCGAGLKRKEHLERHKLGHNPERPYVCGSCGKGFKRREHLNLHAVIHSGVKTEMCGQCGKGFYRKDHLRKHTRSHEIKRARDELNNEIMGVKPAPAPTTNVSVSTNTNTTIMPEITIHVPTSSNMQPVQINIPQHVVTSLNAQAAHAQVQVQVQDDTQAQIDALLAHHT